MRKRRATYQEIAAAYYRQLGYRTWTDALLAHNEQRHIGHAHDFRAICCACEWAIRKAEADDA